MNDNPKDTKRKKVKYASIIFAAIFVILTIFLLTKYGGDFFEPSQSADNPLPTVQTQLPAAQTKQPSSALEQPSVSADSQTDFSKFDGPYDVIYVLDGDTIIAEIDSDHIKIRLIGIDAPESVHYDEDENTPEGELSSDFAKSLLENNRVWLEYDIEQYDQYGRTLAYVYTAEHGMINDYILQNGYAETVVFPPNIKYVEQFAKSEQLAQDNYLGIWSNK